MKLKETLFKRRRVYQGKTVSFSNDTVRLPNGKTAQREYLEHPGAVAVLAFRDKNTILLVKQFRYPVGKITYELPAGKLDKIDGETLVSCVKRELAEETGFHARTVKKLITFWPTAAFSNEVLHIFMAKDLVRSPLTPDEDEFLQSQAVPLTRALSWIKSGRIRDSKTIIAVLFWLAQRGF